MFQAVQVRLREAGKVQYFDTSQVSVEPGAFVIVEVERGLEYGQVLGEPEMLLDSDIEEPLGKVLRIASKSDLNQIEENKRRIKKTIEKCLQNIAERKLDMKLIDAEYSFDRSKIVFYFSAEGRVDFRDLVKDLASSFKARIELKQIGVRDEAKFIGGYGQCGRRLCCAAHLKDFEPVTIRMAKEQNLPLNPAKISGLCGRLMCCLGYEYHTYCALLKSMPREGTVVDTPEGKGKVVSLNALDSSLIVELSEDKKVKVKWGPDLRNKVP